MQAKSIHGKSEFEIQSALEHAISDDFKPNLAIVFMSIKHNRKAIIGLLHNKGIDVFGATSCGEFSDGYQYEGSIVILLMDLNPDSFSIIYEEIGNKAIKEAGHQLAQKALQKYKNPSLIVCSTGMNSQGDYFDGESLVKSINESLGPERLFFGGMAGDDMTFTGSYIFTQGKESDFAIAALVLDADKVSLQGLAITGWKPMGIQRTITKSHGNLVYTIDNKPAVEMYLKYLGSQEDANSQSFNLMNDVSMHYPFIVERQSGGTFLHTPLKIDTGENALEMDVPMPEQTKFWFSIPPDFDIVDEVLQKAATIKSQHTADALLIFSCAGRINVLGPLVNSENEGLHELWKAPMAGFFTYGEYGRDEKNKQEFHSGACCWVAIKEL
jgi:hypothetical protein